MPEKKLPKKIQFLIVGAIAVLASVLYFAFGQEKPDRNGEKPGEAPGTFRPTRQQWDSFKIVTVQNRAFRSKVVTDGSIAYDDSASTQVYSPYSGQVTRIAAKTGDFVSKGSPLMAVAAAEFVQAENDLVTAVNALSTARAQSDLSRKNEDRLHQLYLVKGVALKDWQQSQVDFATANNNRRSAEIALESVRNRLRILGKTEAEISMLERTQKASPESSVLAPVSGTVIQRQVGVGQYINSAAGGAANPLFVIGNTSRMWLVANVREAEAGRVRVGQPVDVHVLAYPGETFRAKIAWIGTSIDPNTHRLPVRAEVENPGGRLKALMYASFDIITGGDVLSPGIPQSAVVYEGSEARVFVVQDNGTIVLRRISTGRTDRDGMVEVSSGLATGERIVTSGTLFIDRAVKG